MNHTRTSHRAFAALLLAASPAAAQFEIEEATIGEIHEAIKEGRTTCVGVVDAYLERARAYNGVCTALVTASAQLYGRNPDLAALPMYCVVAAFKDPFDTKDMRTTSNNDVNFAMDVPPFDSTIVAQLRAKGAYESATHRRAAPPDFGPVAPPTPSGPR